MTVLFSDEITAYAISFIAENLRFFSNDTAELFYDEKQLKRYYDGICFEPSMSFEDFKKEVDDFVKILIKYCWSCRER